MNHGTIKEEFYLETRKQPRVILSCKGSAAPLERLGGGQHLVWCWWWIRRRIRHVRPCNRRNWPRSSSKRNARREVNAMDAPPPRQSQPTLHAEPAGRPL
jgi:hypothetical protein